MTLLDTPPLPHPKVLDREELVRRLDEIRREKRIVFTNGCFDILHPGHADLLARARALGDLLVLGLNSDDSVRRLGKTPPRPLNPLPDRAYVLASLAAVDFVTPFDEDTPYELIKAVRPHVLVKGGDWSLDAIVGRDIVEADGGTVHSLRLLPGYSTTGLIEKIKSL